MIFLPFGNVILSVNVFTRGLQETVSNLKGSDLPAVSYFLQIFLLCLKTMSIYCKEQDAAAVRLFAT